MRTATHISKDLEPEFSLLKKQLDDLTDSVNGTGESIFSRVAKFGDTAKAIAHDTAKLKDKATDTLIEQTETRPLTTLAALVGIGFLAGWLSYRRH